MDNKYPKYPSTLNAKAGSANGSGSKLKSRIVKICIALVVLVIAALLLIQGVRKIWTALYVENKRLTLKNIDFDDTGYYSATTKDGHLSLATILSEAGIELNHTNLLKLNLEDVQAVLEKHPLLTQVKVAKILPDTLKIQAVTRKPIAMLVAKNAQGQIQQFPLAVRATPDDPLNPVQAVLLPDTLPLYNERQHTTVEWKYAVYPAPFNKKIVNETLPFLFDFNLTTGSPEVGLVEQDKYLATALNLVTLTDAINYNRLYSTQQITFMPPDTLRVHVIPARFCKKIAQFAQIDFACSTLDEKTLLKLDQFLNALEQDDNTQTIMYINATGNNFYSSKYPPK